MALNNIIFNIVFANYKIEKYYLKFCKKFSNFLFVINLAPEPL